MILHLKPLHLFPLYNKRLFKSNLMFNSLNRCDFILLFCILLAFSANGVIPYAHIPSKTVSSDIIQPMWCAPDSITDPIGAKRCKDAPILCQNQLNGYTGRLSDTANNLDGNICFTIDNNQWLSFIAGSNNITLNFKVFKCTGGPNGIGDGLQVAILSTNDCKAFNEVVPCPTARQISVGTNQNIPLSGLNIGTKYYIMLDGYTADVCSFTITLVDGVIAPVTVSPTSIIGADSICQAQTASTIQFSVTPTADATSYIWKVPTGASTRWEGFHSVTAHTVYSF